MNDRAFNLAGRKFQLNKINPLTQFHVTRRLGVTLITSLFNGLKEIGNQAEFDKLAEQDKFDKISKVLTPFIEGIGKLSDKDSEYVLLQLLNSVEVYQDSFSNWARVANGEMIAMQDLELPVLLQIAGRAFMFNCAGFFASVPQKK